MLRSVGTAGTISREDLEAWWEGRAMGLASGTRAVDLSHLREFYKWCALFDRRYDDPSVRIRAPKVENAVHMKISNEDVTSLVSKLPRDLARAVMLGAFAGLRVAESAALDWANIDTGEDVILIRGSKGTKARSVPVSPDLIRRLGIDGTIGNVVNAGASASTSDALQQRLNRAMRAAGVHYTSHDLRHRWGMTAYRASHDLLAVAEMMGHASVNTTRIYAAAADEAKRKIASAVML